MTKLEILEYFNDINEVYNNCNMHDTLKHMLDEFESEIKESEWIPIKTRPMTQEEIEECDWYNEDCLWMYACELPDDGEEVLITTRWGSVEKVTFYNNFNEGCYFEEYRDEDDVIAWRQLPEKYQKAR